MGIRGHRGVYGTPLTQVFSVTIKPDGGVCEVYGTIQVIDALGELYIYNRDPKDAETILEYGTISLMCSDRAVSAAADFTVKLDLKEKNGDMEFIKESFSWNGPNLFSYASCLSHNFRGKLGLATMYFSVHSVAVNAGFSAGLDKVLGSGGASVYGRIVAYYGRNFNCLVDNNLKHNFCFVLFDRTFEEAVQLKDGDYIPLLTGFVSVPAYSSLVFEADLHYTHSCGDEEKSANSKVEFSAWDDNLTWEKDGAFRVVVEWKHPNRFIRTPSLKMIRIGDLVIRGYNELVEVFSARMFYDQKTAEGSVEVYGGIRVDDGRNDMSLFSSRKKEYNLISPDGTLALRGPTCPIEGSHFELTLDVKERHQKFVLDGFLIQSPFDDWRWYDCLMCGAVSGTDCYGVIHFAVFGSAVQANVEATLSIGGNTTVHGSLIAFYKNFEYKSNYLKDYFRTRLFDVPEDKPIEVLVKPTSASCASSVCVLEDELMPESEDELAELKHKLIEDGVKPADGSSVLSNTIEDEMMPECEDEPVELKRRRPAAMEGTVLPLSRNVVAVPDRSSLIIEANLFCSTRIDISEIVTRPVKGLAAFLPQTSGATSARIGDKDAFIDVKVSWFNDVSSTRGKLPIETKRHPSVEVSTSSGKKNKFN